METIVTLKLTGVRPMLQHNGRLANPLDPFTKAVAAISKKRGKTEKDIADLAQIEARGGLYETEDGLVGLPAHNVRQCVQVAAKAFKLGRQVDQALIDSPDVVPLLINGQTYRADEYVQADPANAIAASRTVRENSSGNNSTAATAKFAHAANARPPSSPRPTAPNRIKPLPGSSRFSHGAQAAAR